jgi:cytidylate kinase
MNLKNTSERLADVMDRARHHWRERCEAFAVAEVALPPAPPAFVIALSREAGTQGPAIARALGKQLNWPVYDREILQRLADEMGVHPRLLESVDEKKVGWLRECLAAFSSAPAINESKYVRHLTAMLLSLAAQGECIIVGRGAAQVLPPATTLRVRLVGPLADRIETIRQRFGITKEEAAKWVETTDRERCRFVKDNYVKDPNDPCNYDLVLNSSRFSVAECSDLIVYALHKFQARATAGKQRIVDCAAVAAHDS